MKKIEKYGRKAGLEIKYIAETNGTIMNDAIEEFIAEKFSSIGISLDGPKEINDRQRYGNVSSVHDLAIMAIKRLKSKKISISVKCTATVHSINELTNIAEYIGSLGVNLMDFAPADMIPQTKKILMSDNEFETYAREISSISVRNIHQLASGNRTTLFYPIFFLLSQFVTKTRVTHHCAAGREYIAVTADGDVYPCHEFVGIEEFKMGNVNDEDFPGETYNRIKSIFNRHSIYAVEECKSCWARFLCGGDCAVRSYVYNGDLFRPTNRKCILTKSILNALLPEIAEIFQDKNKMQNIIKRFEEYKQSSISKNPLAVQPH
jgi:uncharacterized protein